MSDVIIANPVINSPFEAPTRHFEFGERGITGKIIEGSRGRVAIVSEFLPGVPWSIHNAMQRNLTLCGMSLAMVLIEARKSGGSMAAGKTALELGVPLFAAVYEGMPEPAEGNFQLLAVGAGKLQKSKSTGRANIRRILHVMERGNPPENLPTVNGVRSIGDEQLRAL